MRDGNVELRQGHDKGPVTTLPEQPAGQRASSPRPHALVQSVAEDAVSASSAALAQMFDSCEAGLLKVSELAPSGAVSPAYFEAVLSARSEQGKILRAYARELAGAFQPAAMFGYGVGGGALSLEHLCQRHADTAQEATLRSRIVSRAEHLHADLRQRLCDLIERLNREQGLALPPLALEPASWLGAFHAALVRCEIKPTVRSALLSLYDHMLVPSMAGWMEQALRSLSEREPGLRRDRSRRHGVDQRTLHCLRQVAAASQRSEDADLARSLVEVLHDPDAPLWARAAEQRVRMVGQMINGILNDALLPAAVHPLFESLRMPLIKSALADSSFLTHHGHPVRGLVQELATMAASAQVLGRTALDRTQQLAREVQSQFDLSASFVMFAMQEARVLPLADEQHFDAECKAQEHHRRQEVLQRGRNLVAAQLDESLLASDLPLAISELIDKAWAPLMNLRLLRHGRESVQWRGAVARLEQLVEPFSATAVIDGDDATAAEQSLREISRELNDARMPQQSLYALVGAARRALAERPDPAREPQIRLVSRQLGVADAARELGPDATQQSMPTLQLAVDNEPRNAAKAPSAEVLIRSLCLPGRWFRVYDASQDATRWLRLSSYYPEQGQLSFAEFDGAHPLTISIARFHQDLMTRRSEPIDPDPDTAALLAVAVTAASAVAPELPA